MANEKINPETLYSTVQMGYSHAVRSEGQVVIHCSGQIAWDSNNRIVGEGDIAVQTRQVLVNLKSVLVDAGAEIEDVVQLRSYVVDLNPSLLEPIGRAIAEFYKGITPAANTLIGVQALALPEFLVEIEAVAQIKS